MAALRSKCARKICKSKKKKKWFYFDESKPNPTTDGFSLEEKKNANACHEP